LFAFSHLGRTAYFGQIHEVTSFLLVLAVPKRNTAGKATSVPKQPGAEDEHAEIYSPINTT
jgi:hypothetical protein